MGGKKTELGERISLWIESAPASTCPSLTGEVKVDVAVIGGGIAGLTTAMLLKENGLRVAVLEAGRVGHGVSGHTTGKISSLHRLIYHELVKSFGKSHAKTYGEANQKAIDLIFELITRHKIDCDFRRVTNYTFAESQDGLTAVKEEAEVAKRLDLPASFTTDVPLPFLVKGAVQFSGQAQFHITKYLAGMAKAIDGNGSFVFENTNALTVKDKNTIVTDVGQMTADTVVIASNTPFLNRGLYFLRSHPYRSYLIAGEVDTPIHKVISEGTYISAEDPLRSIMPYSYGSSPLLLIGGEGHRTGEKVDTLSRYRHLQDYARSRFELTSIKFSWSTQDMLSLDGLPYIGRLTPFSSNIYVATGFRKWGLSNGTVAAMILCDQILGKDNPWADTFNSNRITIVASTRRFLSENFFTVQKTAESFLTKQKHPTSRLQQGQGTVQNIEGSKIAVSRSNDGELYAVSAICTHLGCVVDWNSADSTWDCPCHGSRFDQTGSVIQGPATKPLSKKEISDDFNR